MFGLSSNI